MRKSAAVGGLDALVLDASLRQALVATRSLGRFGLAIGLVESAGFALPAWSTLAFASRWASACGVVPDFQADPEEYGKAVLDLAMADPGSVILPCSDQSITSLRPWRSRIEAFCRVAMADDAALSIAVDKDRTIDLARDLAIRVPPTVRIRSGQDIVPAIAGMSYPLVVKPTSSWLIETAGERLFCRVAATRDEALDVIGSLTEAGVAAHVQPWLPGRREAVSIFRAHGRIAAAFAQSTERTTPVLGGASVIRRSIPLPDDVHHAAVSLVDAMNLDGFSDVEFRRDGNGRPHLMEVNARLSGSVELAFRSGVDFPLMTWQWARGLPVSGVTGYQTGVRMRWLRGDLRWLKETLHGNAGPDGVSRRTAVATFVRSFASPQMYDGFDVSDPWPAVVDLGGLAAKWGRLIQDGSWRRRLTVQ